MSRRIVCLIISFGLLSCAGQGIEPEAKALLPGGDVHILYRLYYVVDGEHFNYATYELEDTGQWLQVLADATKVRAISALANAQDAYAPDIQACTLFPYRESLDVNVCFSEFNSSLMAANDAGWYQAAQQPQSGNESGSLIGTTLVLGPVIVPATVFAAPLWVFDYLSANAQRKQFHLQLGLNPALDEYLATIGERAKSLHDGKGTAYIEAGVTMQTPALAFGFQGDEVIWIQRDPSWSCGGGFMFWGNTCSIGKHSSKQ